MADRLEVMLELERRGKLPADKTEILSELRRRGKLPSPDIEDMGTVRKFLAGVGGGMQLLAKGVQQIPGKLLLADTPQLQRVTKEGEEISKDLERLKSQSTAAKIGAFVGEAAPTMVLPGGVTGGALKRAATSALAGATQGATKFTREGESTASNVAMGAIGGGFGSAGMGAAGKLINVIGGKIVKPAARELGEKFNIPTTLGEEINNPHVVRAETWMERIPLIGIKGFREKQHKATEQASKGFMAKYVRNPDEIRGALDENREYVSVLYEAAKQKIAKAGTVANSSITATDTRVAAKELLTRYPDLFKKFQDTKLEGYLNNIVQDTGIKTATSPILSVSGKPIVTQLMPKMGFDDMWELRKGLGALIGQAKKQLQGGMVNETEYGMLNKLYSSVNKDIDSWTTKIGQPEISTAFKTANNAYKQYVVKYSILERAFDKAAGAEEAGKVFSPKRFSNELNKILIKEKYYGSFSEAEKKEMAGLANILSVVKRAGEYAENPPTGARLAEPGIVMTVAGFGKTVPYAVLAKFLSTTKAGKNLVLAASKVEPESAVMKSIVNQSYKLASRASASGILDLAEDEGDYWQRPEQPQ